MAKWLLVPRNGMRAFHAFMCRAVLQNSGNHPGRDPGLVDEHETLRIRARLVGFSASPRHRPRPAVLFGRTQSSFKVRSCRLKKRSPELSVLCNS